MNVNKLIFIVLFNGLVAVFLAVLTKGLDVGALFPSYRAAAHHLVDFFVTWSPVTVMLVIVWVFLVRFSKK